VVGDTGAESAVKPRRRVGRPTTKEPGWPGLCII